MAKKIYLASLSKDSGKSLIALGLMSSLSREYTNPAFFKPIACLNDAKTDHYLNVMYEYFNMPFQHSELFGLSWDEAAMLVNQDKNELFKLVIQRYKTLEKKVDFVLCEGTDFTNTNNAFEFELNAEIANNLGCQILCVADAVGKSLKGIIQDIEMSLKAFQEKKCEVLGIIVNRVNYENEEAWTKKIQSYFKDLRFIGIIPSKPELAMPSIADIARALDASYLTGKNMSNRLVKDYSIAARHVGHFLDSKKKRTDFLVITAGDRDDVILGCSLANQSIHYPKIAGLLLTTGTKPSENILRILAGLDYPIPILSTEQDTLKTIHTLEAAQFHTRADQTEKIHTIIEHFQHHINEKLLIELITENSSHKLTPQMFTFNLVQKAMNHKKHIVLPEGEDNRILEAAHYILKRDIADLTLLGDIAHIQKVATSHGWDLSKAEILDPKSDNQHAAFAELYYDLRKHKNVNLTIAQDRLHLPTYFGTLMVHTGKADGMVSGAAHTTGETIRPALEVIKTKTGASIVSSVFLMCLEDRVAVYGDCAVNPQPNADQLAEIALQSAATARQFELPVRIAMLSYSSGQSGVGESVEKVRSATEKAKTQKPDLLIEGPIQYDAAVDEGIAAKKMPHSTVAGHASILIFPDLNTGNNTYKAVQRETGAIAIGPVLQGLKKPVNDLSRGCSVIDIINTIVITAIQAQKG